jgi:predicted Zn-ribbon and HTH transcriptional regulator
MINQCPNCQSERLIILDFAQKTEEVIGRGGDATGIPTNAKLEETTDDNILDNYQCLDCGYEFDCRRSGLKQRLGSKVQSFNR